ncbi:MAG: cysteine desulfurase [Dehalococcoidia bacterium]|nr:cysteine desulfurase [Dehalococcoidia bacterium]MDW8120211.1 cysteine desulfurase [Chloroflexota bacterium]
MLDLHAIRRDFPVLQRTVHGRPLVYLDNAATSQKPRQVIQALVAYYEGYNANVHRAVHTLGEEATQRFEEARQKVADFIHAPSLECILWTRNTTEAINLVATAWALPTLKPGDEVLTSAMEHHSNLVPWQKVCAQTGATLRIIPLTPQGLLDMDAFQRMLSPRVRLVAITHMSNVLGSIVPVAEVARLAHSVGAVVLVDGAQSVPHMPVDVQAIDCDFLAFSAHKMLGPTGIGVLYGKLPLLEAMEPFLLGGEMVREVTYERATWKAPPFKYEAGTPNIADAIAFGVAIDYLKGLGMEHIRQHEIALTRYALRRFAELEEFQVFGPPSAEQRGGVISFCHPHIHPHDLGTFLDRFGIAIRAGHHCAMPLVRSLGVVATARASFYLYNTEEEVDILIDALRQALRFFGRVRTPR